MSAQDGNGVWRSPCIDWSENQRLATGQDQPGQGERRLARLLPLTLLLVLQHAQKQRQLGGDGTRFQPLQGALGNAGLFGQLLQEGLVTHQTIDRHWAP